MFSVRGTLSRLLQPEGTVQSPQPGGTGSLAGFLDEALTKPLTLLAASARWGKTTLLAAWAHRYPRAVAWLSLDPLDNDPFRFWAAVIAALRTRVSGIGSVALALMHSPQPPPFSAVLTALLNDLAEQAVSIVLLLDDYQVIADPLIQETVGQPDLAAGSLPGD